MNDEARRRAPTAKEWIVDRARYLDGAVIETTAKLRENYRSHKARIEAAKVRAELNGILHALQALDGRIGEGTVHTAKRYGLKAFLI
jgi:hypothetical protein